VPDEATEALEGAHENQAARENQAVAATLPIRDKRWLLLGALLMIGLCQIQLLAMGLSPEDWTLAGFLQDRSLVGSFAPVADFPYYRPIWFGYLKLCHLLGLSGGLMHLGPLLAHLLGLWGLHRLLRDTPFGWFGALGVIFLAGLAPGTAPALSWLAAGNKPFVFAALVWGLVLLREARGWRAFGLALLPAALLPLGMSENAYMMCLLYPLGLWLPGKGKKGIAHAAVALIVTVAFSLVQLAMLPPPPPGTSTRVAELQASWLGAPLDSLFSIAENIGRFFLFDIGVATNAARLGVLLLLFFLLLGLLETWRGQRARGHALLWSLAFLLIANLPASLFPGESSRHHAYLPAIGAAPLLLSLILLLPRRSWELVLALLFALFFVRTVAEQRIWKLYLDHSERVFASSIEVLPEYPEGEMIACLNVPWEYRAAFALRLGHRKEIEKWPDFCVMTTRESWLPPKGVSLPKGDQGIWIEYDGQRLRRTRIAELERRSPSPRAWLVDVLRPFPEPLLQWGAILSSREPLQVLPWSQSPRVGTGLAARPTDLPATADGQEGAKKGVQRVRLRIDKEEPGKDFYVWELEADTADWRWLVLGWSPVFFRTTENIGPFLLTSVPWAFRTRILDRDTGQPVAIEVLPALGLLPALRLPPGKHRLRVELRFR